MGLDVNREELMKALRYDRGQYDKGYADGCRDSRKHGRWKTLECDMGEVGGYAPYIVVECSICGEAVGIEQGQYGWAYGDPFPWKCCPLCEARMDGGNENDKKEKLVELLKIDPCPSPFMCSPECRYSDCDNCFTERFADHLIANGVTMQEWIPVTERLPQNDQYALCFMQNGSFRVLQWSYIAWMWNNDNERYEEEDVTHWMPLPVPPKGK